MGGFYWQNISGGLMRLACLCTALTALSYIKLFIPTPARLHYTCTNDHQLPHCPYFEQHASFFWQPMGKLKKKFLIGPSFSHGGCRLKSVLLNALQCDRPKKHNFGPLQPSSANMSPDHPNHSSSALLTLSPL